jgi:hypothetical protein
MYPLCYSDTVAHQTPQRVDLLSSLEPSRRPDRDRLERQVRQTDEVQPGHRQPRGPGNGTQHPRRNHQRLRLHGRRHIWYDFFSTV